MVQFVSPKSFFAHDDDAGNSRCPGVDRKHVRREREQIYLATRLALADVLAKGERQLVVLDDVLVATDSGRFARVMRILKETAQRLQVLILTCHPERYMGLDGARFFDLEVILRESAQA